MWRPEPDDKRIDAVRGALAQWYGRHRRRLPWRELPTPYRVWISEMMLQQTQVVTVIPYFERFMIAYPDVQALAEAPEAEVLGLWSGLGYYRRCRLLHRAAKEIVGVHGGALPTTVEALMTLPGVGRYTAGAIASIAHGVAAPVLDGNVTRVLTRLTGDGVVVGTGEAERTLWALAGALLDPTAPGAHNQAMMELGALVCRPQGPDCDGCPLTSSCEAASEGHPERYPVKKPRPKPRPMHAVCGLVRDGEEALLMARRPEQGLLGGLWELPGGELADRTPRPVGLAKVLKERLNGSARVGGHLASVEHVFTHRHLTLDVYTVHELGGDLRSDFYTEWRWVSPSGLDTIPLSTLTRKVLAAVGVGVEGGP